MCYIGLLEHFSTAKRDRRECNILCFSIPSKHSICASVTKCNRHLNHSNILQEIFAAFASLPTLLIMPIVHKCLKEWQNRRFDPSFRKLSIEGRSNGVFQVLSPRYNFTLVFAIWVVESMEVGTYHFTGVLSPKSQVWHECSHGNTFWRWSWGLVLSWAKS